MRPRRRAARAPRRPPGNGGAELRRAARDHLVELVEAQRLELDHRAAREERLVHLEVGVLGRRPDERHEAVLHRVQDGVLLTLVEPVDLVDEEERSEAVAAEPVARPGENGADVVDPCRDRGQLLELGGRRVGDDPGDRRLPDTRRPVEDHGRRPPLLDRPT